MRTLIINTILGVVLLFLTNLVLADDIPINLLTVIICAIGGVKGGVVFFLTFLLWQEPAATQVADHAPADLVAPHLTPLVHENVTHLPDLLALLGDYLGTGDRLTLLVQLGDLEVFPQLVERLFTPDHNYITHARHRSPAQCSTMPNHAANQQRHDIE